MIVVALTIWVININDTYSTDSSTTPKCKTINGIEYKYVSNATNDQYGCCPVSDTAKIGSLGNGNKCFSYNVNGSCPTGYTVYNEGNCIANLGEIDNSACYYCTGNSVTGSNYLWSSGTPSVTCNGGSWIPQENITSSDKVESFNMHTKSGVGVDKEKISKVTTNDDDSALSILKEIYKEEKEKDNGLEFAFLDRFMNYVNSIDQDIKL